MTHTQEAIEALFAQPFFDLLFEAHTIHRRHFDPADIQVSTLLSIKTGGCPEDCGYCPQSRRHDTGVEDEDLLSVEEVVAAARRAKANGADRFCMGAAWRGPKERDIASVTEMIAAIRGLGLETCATLGLLRDGQAEQLARAGLDYYNHNLDTSPEFYGDVIQTRGYEDRLATLSRVRKAGLKVCCGGIVGMGESRRDRAGLIAQLAALDPPPESVPINLLVRVPGTPLADTPSLEPLEFVRTIAVARICLPQSRVRLSAGREGMSEEMQALCFFAGANSLFVGDTLLTTANPSAAADRALFAKLGLRPLKIADAAEGAGPTDQAATHGEDNGRQDCA
ncbi:MAG TPA: biotin synthase BioB [Acidiferrobacter sp.]|nr:biotin synthase BioB [Acidiferrobacter sp.]